MLLQVMMLPVVAGAPKVDLTPGWLYTYVHHCVATEFLYYFGDPRLTSVQSEMRLVNGIFGPSNISQQVRLGLWDIGLLKVPFATPGISYCSW